MNVSQHYERQLNTYESGMVRKQGAARDVLAWWQRLEIAEKFPLDEIARAHESVEHPTMSGRVIVTI